MRYFKSLMIRSAVCFLLVFILTTNLFQTVKAESGAVVDISTEATNENYTKVKNLADQLYYENNFSSQNGGYNISTRSGYFTWDSESISNHKYRSWTYYTGIMMDAFLMLDSSEYEQKVEDFYSININSNGNVDKTNPLNANFNKNEYKSNELDSIPPTRALFDLIRDNSVNKDKYIRMIENVYSLMQDTSWIVPDTDGNFIHKRNNSNWSTYQIALDGLYMAQPFFMELAKAKDDGIFDSSSYLSSIDSDALYTAVANRMLWIGDTLYDANTGLYNHAWGPSVNVNGHFWLRAIGWYAAALADVISMLPDSYADMKNELIAVEERLFDGMIRYQHDSGMWYNVVNRDDTLSGNKLESSGSALMAYAMMKLYAEGYVGDTYGEAGLKAFNGTVDEKMAAGDLTDVYRSSGVETTDQGYLKSTYETNEAKGVGPLMMAATYAEAAAEKYNAKTDPEWTAPAANSGLTYNGSTQALVSAGSTEDGTIEYALGEDGTTVPGENVWTADVPSGRDAGNYYVWYRLIGDAHHNDAGPHSITVEIAGKRVKITGISAKDKTYDGTTAAEITGTPALSEDSGTFGLFSAIRNFLVTGGAVENGDEVNVEYGQAAFADANVGKNKTVSFSDFSLSGSSASNYELTGQPKNVTADIDPKEATVTARDQTIREGESLVMGTDQAVLEGMLEGHSLSSVSFEIINNEKIMPRDAAIKDASDQDVTGNYDISYSPGNLTVVKKVNYTVTFKVENGLWNDASDEDKTVELSGYEGDTLKLGENQIPAVGNKPAEGYEAGSWNPEPDTQNAVTENKVYTYTYALQQQGDLTPTPDPTISPEPTITPDSSTPAAPGDLAVDGAISVSRLQTGDKASFYQVLKFSPDAADTGGWIAAPGFEALTKDEIEKILSLGDYAPGKSKASEAGIDETLAARIADMAEQTNAKYPDIEEADGTASRTNPEPGLYVALITPGQPGTIYNPIFVAADYDGENQTNSWRVNLNDSYEPASMAKKGEITLTKTAATADGNADGVSVGDVVSFALKTTIPEFGNDYTNAVFKVTDTLSAGLELKTDTIHVYKDAVDPANLLVAADTYAAGKAYKCTTDTSGEDTFTVDFFTQYILGLDAVQDIVITYEAQVTTTAPASVNLEDNTATVCYSNQPTDATGNGTLRDETKHYTFDIDANILGDNAWKTTEVVKVGLGADGMELSEVVSLHEGQSVGALEGAEFKLYVPVIGGTHELRDSEGNTIHTEPYTNSILTSGKIIVSDSTGRLTIQGETLPGIRGLDLGTYYLVEEKAPAGYVRYSNAVKVEILAPDDTEHWETKTYEETRNGYTYTWDVKELKKYEVRINDATTAEYTFLNEENEASAIGSSTDTAVKGDTITGSESAGYIGRPGASEDAGRGKIVNTQGAELPSTGGPGTMIFYLIGMILVVLAGAGLVVKRGRI